MADRFKAKVVLVAGGTGGLGKAVTLAFLQESAKVIVTSRNPDSLASVKAVAGDSASSLAARELDVTDDAATQRVVQELVREHGRIDVLINAVGGYAGGTPLWSTTPETFDRMLALNLRAGFVLCRAIAPVMLQQGSGAIVNVASRAAFDHGAGAGAYAASKAAAVAMIDSLAADLQGKGVRANSVIPSIFDTEDNRRAMPKADFTRWPKPEDIAQVILFLCSDEARLIHGASVPVYGNT